MSAKNNPDSSTADREILLSRVFDAPRELVWEAMTDPKQVAHWWGPRGFTTTIEEMDVRPGGVWKHVMRGPDGTEYPNKSIFKEVVKPERIVYSHGGARKGGGPGANFIATWTFDALPDGKTKLTMHMVFPTAEARDIVVKEYGAIEGGKQTLARLAEELAKTPVVIERTFDAPQDAVWKAITDFSEMKQWYFPQLQDFKAEVGFQTQVNVRHNEKDYLHIWKVTEVVPGSKITYSWRYSGLHGESFLTFELFPDGTKTKLRLTHKGLETFQPETNPDYARGNFLQGWTYFGQALGQFLDKSAPPGDRDFVISRVFAAPRELVWRAWTEPKHMAQWWGPRDFTNPVCEMDVRPGGKYRITMRGPDGDEYPMEGEFREVVDQERLVLWMDCSTHPEEWHDMVNPNRDRTKKPTLFCLQIVTFENAGDKTKLTVRTRLESKDVRDNMVKVGMNEGWSGSLERLESLLAKMR